MERLTWKVGRFAPHARAASLTGHFGPQPRPSKSGPRSRGDFICASQSVEANGGGDSEPWKRVAGSQPDAGSLTSPPVAQSLVRHARGNRSSTYEGGSPPQHTGHLISESRTQHKLPPGSSSAGLVLFFGG